MLAEVPGREIVMGAVTQPWRADVRFQRLPPESFAEFNAPGYAKIVWTLVAEPLGPEESIFRTETRVVTTDSESRRRVRLYWSIFSPGILLIRNRTLHLVSHLSRLEGFAATTDQGVLSQALAEWRSGFTEHVSRLNGPPLSWLRRGPSNQIPTAR
jgi:hypothetical protein